MTNKEYIEEWLKDEYSLNPKDREVLTAALKALEELPKRRKEVKRWKTKALEQQKMGCEGCIYEKTGNNSTYPCSHCSRCYTDKYKVESEE